LKSEKKRFILVDHNEKKQTIDDIEEGEVVEIVDHHRIGDIETSNPIMFRNMIVGSTCTIVEMMYRERGLRMSDEVAQLVAYGVISDTMNFHSPTCTQIDLDMRDRLEKEYGLDLQAMAIELFENTATIKGKDFKSLLYNDTKEYALNSNRINVSQVFTFNLKDVDEIKDDFLEFMKQENKKYNYDLMVIAFTNIEGNGSKFLYVGKLAKDVDKAVENFEKNQFVSRKKQIVPGLAQALS
jgi:manganese-dependent inorganic pyrophosphatase